MNPPTDVSTSEVPEVKDESTKAIERYVRYVENVVRRFKTIGNLVRLGEVAPDKVNWALSQLYDMSLLLNAEYQRVKSKHQILEDEYQAWYDEKFIEARNAVISFYQQNKSVKPSVKEYEVELRHSNRIEFKDWSLKRRESQAKVDFLLRLRDILHKYDSSLVTLSANMRGEMKALSTVERGGKATEQTQRIRVAPVAQPEVDPLTFDSVPMSDREAEADIDLVEEESEE